MACDDMRAAKASDDMRAARSQDDARGETTPDDARGEERPGSGQSLASAFANAFKGIAAASRERNFRIECGIGVVALVLNAVLGVSAAEWAVVVACAGLVLALECLNTALEAAVDLASPGWNDLAGLAKDAAAGAVLAASIASLVVGLIIYVPRIAQMLGWL